MSRPGDGPGNQGRGVTAVTLMLMTVEELGAGEGHDSLIQRFSKVRLSLRPKALGLSGTFGSGVLCRWGGSVDALCVHSECARLGV